jgi:hypothetical protein
VVSIKGGCQDGFALRLSALTDCTGVRRPWLWRVMRTQYPRPEPFSPDPFQTTGITVDHIGCRLERVTQEYMQQYKPPTNSIPGRAPALTMIPGPSCIPATRLRKDDSLQFFFLA